MRRGKKFINTRLIQFNGSIRWGFGAIAQQKSSAGSFQHLKGRKRLLIERARYRTDVFGITTKKRWQERKGQREDDRTLLNGTPPLAKYAFGKRHMTILER